jgi:hypothetical protein
MIALVGSGVRYDFQVAGIKQFLDDIMQHPIVAQLPPDSTVESQPSQLTATVNDSDVDSSHAGLVRLHTPSPSILCSVCHALGVICCLNPRTW